MMTRRSIFGLCLAPMVPSMPEPRISWAAIADKSTDPIYQSWEACAREADRRFLASNRRLRERGWMVDADGSVRLEIFTRGGGGGGGTQETNPVT